MSFGAGRLVSKRDSPNIRHSFDALKLTLPWRRGQIQAFVGRPIVLFEGAFDDKPGYGRGILGYLRISAAA